MQMIPRQEVVIHSSTISHRWLLVFLSLSTVLCTILVYTFTIAKFVQPDLKYYIRYQGCHDNNTGGGKGGHVIHNGTTGQGWCQKCFMTYKEADYPGGRRLGNHIYNVASLIGIARLNRMTPLLPENARIFLSMDVPVQVVKVSAYKKFVKESHHFKEVDSRKFDPRVTNLTCNVTLVGFFQSWRYLKEVQHLIANQFRFKEKFVTKAQSLYDSYIRNKQSDSVIGIHVRRGFTLQKLQKRGYVTPGPSYFQHAMEYYQHKIYPNKTLLYLISSDDIKWCKKNIKGDQVIYSTAEHPEVDILLQSFCNDSVTSLGSFGWWCGYFAQGQMVYFKDFARPGSAVDKEVNITDMFYPQWKAMS